MNVFYVSKISLFFDTEPSRCRNFRFSEIPCTHCMQCHQFLAEAGIKFWQHNKPSDTEIWFSEWNAPLFQCVCVLVACVWEHINLEWFASDCESLWHLDIPPYHILTTNRSLGGSDWRTLIDHDRVGQIIGDTHSANISLKNVSAVF